MLKIAAALGFCAALLHAQAGAYTGTGTPDTEGFGGLPFCDYSITMQNVRMSITIDSSGNATGTLSGLAIEMALNGCPFPPIPANAHQFTGSGSVSGGKISMTFQPSPNNAPLDQGMFTGTVSAGSIQGTLNITRTDLGPPLSWTTVHTMTLTGAGGSISSGALPSATVGTPYSATLAATGGTPPYSNWRVASGTLPPGIELNHGTGNLDGTPTSASGSPFTFSITATDSAGVNLTPQQFSIAVAQPSKPAQLSVRPASLASMAPPIPTPLCNRRCW